MPHVIYTKEKRKKKVKGPSANPLLFCPCCRKKRKISEVKGLLSLEKTYNEKHINPYGVQPTEGWALQVAINGRLIWACDICLTSGRAITAKPWLQVPSLSNPDFAYADKEFTCEDCGRGFTFSAREQQYWYETLQFVRDSYPKQCPPCRRKRRIYERHFHDLQRAIESLDSKSAGQLANVAELYIRIGNFDKALEFFRRAKNNATSQIDKDELQQRIKTAQNELGTTNHHVANP